MFFVRKLNYFKIDKSLISLFYQSVVQSIISFCICVWGGNANTRAISKINSVAKQSFKITNIPQLSFSEILAKYTEKKIIRIIKDTTHPLNMQIGFSSRSKRLAIIRTKTESYRKSIIPRTVKLLYDAHFLEKANFYR